MRTTRIPLSGVDPPLDNTPLDIPTSKHTHTLDIPALDIPTPWVDPESVRLWFRYSQIQIWTPVTSKLPVSSFKYQDENNNI